MISRDHNAVEQPGLDSEIDSGIPDSSPFSPDTVPVRNPLPESGSHKATSDNHLRFELRAILDKERHDAVVFSLLTVILTPVFIILGVILIMYALIYVDLPLIDHLGYRLSIVTGVNLAIGFMVVSCLLTPKARDNKSQFDILWVAIALGFFCMLLILSYETSLAQSNPPLFWLIYLLLAFSLLGCIGHAYEPRDDHYLGMKQGPAIVDNPFTIKDDIDRAHFYLGFALSMSCLVLESYASIFGSTWLWRRLKEPELSVAVALLTALSVNDAACAKSSLHSLNKSSALNLVRTLVKLEMIEIKNGFPRLCGKGREFLALQA